MESENEARKVLDTYLRSKVPNWLSYPVGAQTVSDALRGIPQFEKLTLSFSFYGKAENLAKLRAAEPSTILNATFNVRPAYHGIPDAFVERGWLNEQWSITVYPVSRQVKHDAAKALLAEGLPAIRKWLLACEQNRPVATKSLTVTFDPADGTIRLEEHQHA